MRLITTVLLAAVASVWLAAPAAAETKVKVKVKENTGIGQKAKVKGVTATRLDGPVTAFTLDGGATVTVKPLDAAANPFSKVYTDYDRWVFEHAHPDLRLSDLKWVDGKWVYVDNGNPVDVVVARVNPQGYLLPVSEKSVAVGPTVPVLPRGNARGHYYVIATGSPEPELRRVYVRERARVLAPVAPKVPDWIIRQPGERVVFTPGDDYLVLRDGVWYRYDVSGKVVAQTKPGESWQVLYWPKYREVVTTVPENVTVLSDSGYTVLRDANGNITAVYDYDGTPIKVENVTVQREPFYFEPLDWDAVLDLRDAQLELDVDGAGVDADVDVRIAP